MAIGWGAWEYSGGNGMRLGIETTISAVTSASTNVTFTVKYYTQNQYAYSDAQTLTYSGNITGTQNYTNNDGSAAQLRDTETHVYTYSTYGSSPGTRSFGATVSGAFNGVTPQHTQVVNIPARPYNVPNPPTSVVLTRNSDVQGTLTWTRNPTAARPYTSQPIRARLWYESGTWSGWTEWYDTVVVSGTATSYVKTTEYSANNVYQLSIRALNSVGSSTWADSNIIYMTPAAPSNVASVLNSSGTSITTTWTDNAYTYGSTVTWTVQRSVNGGAFANVQTGIAKGVRTYTDPAPGGGTNRYRVAAVQVNGALTSSFTQGNLVSTVAPPLAPTLLNPNGTFVDFVNDAVTLTWKHNPGGDGAAQTHYIVEFSSNSGTTWVAYSSGTVASAVSSHTVPAGSLVNGVPYLWRVRTEGVVSAGFGPNSASATIQGSTRPTVTLILPEATTTSAPIRAEWSYAQPELSPQIAFQAQLYADDGTTLLQEISGFDDTSAVAFSYVAITGNDYIVRVRAQSAAGVWSAFAEQLTSFDLLPPAVPIVTGTYQPCSGTVLLELVPVAPVEGVTVDTQSVTIERRVDGGDWVILGQGILIPTNFLDTLPMSNGLNEYRITALSNLPSTAQGPIVQVYGEDGWAKGDPLWVWVNYGDTFEFRLRVRGDLSMSETAGRLKSTQHFLGRAKPVALVGQALTLNIAVTGQLYYDRRCLPDDGCTFDSHPREWRSAGNDSEVVCYRDFTGRRIFGVLSDVTVQDGVWPGKAGVGFTVTQVDFVERYVQFVEA